MQCSILKLQFISYNEYFISVYLMIINDEYIFKNKIDNGWAIKNDTFGISTISRLFSMSQALILFSKNSSFDALHN